MLILVLTADLYMFSAEDTTGEDSLSPPAYSDKRAKLQIGFFTGFGISKHLEMSAFPDGFLLNSSKRFADFAFFVGLRLNYFFTKKIGIMISMDINQSKFKEEIVLSTNQRGEESFSFTKFDFAISPLFRLGYVLIYPGVYVSMPASLKRKGWGEVSYSLRAYDVGIKLGFAFTGYVSAISPKVEYSLGLEFNCSLLKKWGQENGSYTGSRLMRIYAVIGIMYSVE